MYSVFPDANQFEVALRESSPARCPQTARRCRFERRREAPPACFCCATCTEARGLAAGRLARGEYFGCRFSRPTPFAGGAAAPPLRRFAATAHSRHVKRGLAPGARTVLDRRGHRAQGYTALAPGGKCPTSVTAPRAGRRPIPRCRRGCGAARRAAAWGVHRAEQLPQRLDAGGGRSPSRASTSTPPARAGRAARRAPPPARAALERLAGSASVVVHGEAERLVRSRPAAKARDRLR